MDANPDRGDVVFFEQERIDKILKELQSYIYTKTERVTEIFMKHGDFKNLEQAEQSGEPWRPFLPDERWGGKDQRCWFKLELTIPKEFEGMPVVFEIKTGREGEWDALNPQFLIYLDGKIIQGLDVNHRDIIVSESARGGEAHRIDLHAYAGMKEGLVELKAQVSALDRLAEKLYFDIKVPLEAAKLLSKEDKRYIDMMAYLVEAINLLDLRKPGSKEYSDSLKRAEQYLEEELYQKYCGNSSATASIIGHTHIDVAWLWTLKQTREKVARSFSTALNLMKEYPEFLFMASQPQLYKFLKEDHPEIYEELKERVKEGRWEAEGGMWLEADCNLVSGESLIRQILIGTRFFKEEFGVDNKILWLPDVFGYSAALPQILHRFGMKYFLTTKISWNEYNKMPYDTFLWEGLDGTAILTYFVTTAEYNKVMANNHRTVYEGHINPSQMMGAWQRYQQKNISDEILVSFGYGDGGGGATKEMLENARRLERGIPGCPRVKMSRAGDFFERLEEKAADNKKLPRWVGELYLEYHRGTYTSMARNKRYNRKCEFLYQDIEFLHVLNTWINKAAVYPKEEINQGWEGILLNQFHDIISGSSIKEVYDESLEQYQEVVEKGDRLLNSAKEQITSQIDLKERSLIVFNQLSFARNDVVIFDMPADMGNIQLVDSSQKVYPVQSIGCNKGIAYVEGIPPKGYKAFAIREMETKAEAKVQIMTTTQRMTNQYFDITLDEYGSIISIYDKRNHREVLKRNTKANVWQAFEDKPHNFDAWDINIYYQEKMWEIQDVREIRVEAIGAVRATLKIEKAFMDSIITQYMHIYNDIPRIDFENEVDWKESHILVKAAFPVDVHSSKATYDIQYGNIERSTHWNTSWDTAKFEVCAHKWADLSEDGYGVSLLNDCKYGYDIKDGVMRLTLLKSPKWPNPEADKEMHYFTYSLYPHGGDWKDGNTVQSAYMLNCPMYSRVEEAHEGILPEELYFMKVNQPNVTLEVIKQAEQSEDTIIRVFECYNRRCTVTVESLWAIETVKETDLNEKDLASDIAIQEKGFCFEIKPYEIRTFKIKLREGV